MGLLEICRLGFFHEARSLLKEKEMWSQWYFVIDKHVTMMMNWFG